MLERVRFAIMFYIKRTNMKTALIKCITEKDSLSKRQQCELPGINRETLYYKPTGEKQETLEIMRVMDEHHLKHPTDGVLRMQDYLFLKGFLIRRRFRMK